MTASDLPRGMKGLQYPITQVSLVVAEMDELMERYYRSFGWAPWQDFDHVPPNHHNTMYRGREVEYSLRGAEVYVGSLNFELLVPLPNGDSLFHTHLRERGNGIASIASMFHERDDGDAVKEGFREHFGLELINRAEIGDHIEYYYVDTQEAFGCPIESGSGHAIDFEGPARVYPSEEHKFGPSPESGIEFRITQITLVARDLRNRVSNYQKAFGWGPWGIFDTSQDKVLENGAYRDHRATFDIHFAQVMVGDMNFEIIEPRSGAGPWQNFLQETGEGLIGITVKPMPPATTEDALSYFRDKGIGTLASGLVGGSDWHLLDSQNAYATHIAIADQTALESVAPLENIAATS